MPGKTHVPNVPTGNARTLSNRRSLKGILDSRRFQESDLRTVEVVGVWGKGFFRVKNPGGGIEYIVANETMRTFAPGAQVLAGSHSGMPGEVVFGGPPPGKQGSSGGRGRRPAQQGVVQTNQYAFFNDGGNLMAWFYLDATYIADYGSTSLSDVAEIHSCILSDSEGKVGPGTALANEVGDLSGTMGGIISLYACDILNGTTHTYNAPSGWHCSQHFYKDGYLWWAEYEHFYTGDEIPAETIDLRLRRSRCDFTDVTTIATWVAPTLAYYDHTPPHLNGFNYTHWDSDFCRIALCSTGAIVFGNPWISDYQDMWVSNGLWRILIAYDGGEMTPASGQQHGDPPDGDIPANATDDMLFSGPMASNGSAVGAYFFNDGNGDQIKIVSQTGNSAVEATQLWPFLYDGTSAPSGISASGGLIQVQIYDSGLGAYNYHRDSAVEAPTGETAAVVFTPVAHPVLGPTYLPGVMFYYGA